MKSNAKILALIGARSGSVGLKDKNIKKIRGLPLMAWIIKAARNSKYINRIIVSTDSKKYSRIANRFGAETPFIRPKNISTKYSDEIDYILHALDFLKKKEKYIPDIIVRLLITCPLQKSSDIDKLIKLLLKNKNKSAVIIAKAKQHPQKALKIKNNKLVSYVSGKGIDVGKNNNRQKNDINERVYFRANVIACKLEVLNKNKSLTDENVKFIKVSNINNIDIDDEIDFEIAKILVKKNKFL